MAARATLEVRRVLDSMVAMRVFSSLCDDMNEKCMRRAKNAERRGCVGRWQQQEEDGEKGGRRKLNGWSWGSEALRGKSWGSVYWR
jgi:hypothetical protein